MTATSCDATFEAVVVSPGLLESTLFTLVSGRVLLFFEGPAFNLMYKYSDDVGRTWSEGQPCVTEDDIPFHGRRPSPVQLPNGEVGLLHTSDPQRRGRDGTIVFRTSSDQCKTWSQANWVDRTFAVSRMHTTRVLSTGRIVAPVMRWISPLVNHESEIASQSLCYSWVKHSDDGGRSWVDSDSELFVRLDSISGAHHFEEPAIEQLKDGTLLMLGRTEMGRFFASQSHDDGATWSAPQPTEIAAGYTPCHLVRIPKTGDLMLVWNQTSPEEVERGLSRSRLTVAISHDEGNTWQHHRNLESPDAITYIAPPPIKVHRQSAAAKRAFGVKRYIGEHVIRRICYPSVTFVDNEVLFCYDFDRPEGSYVTKLKILPLDMLYT